MEKVERVAISRKNRLNFNWFLNEKTDGSRQRLLSTTVELGATLQLMLEDINFMRLFDPLLPISRAIAKGTAQFVNCLILFNEFYCTIDYFRR